MNIFHLLFVFELYAILSLSANLLSGYTGLLSFANAAFYGLGAYTASLAMKKLGLGYMPSVLICISFCFFCSLITTFFSIRLKDIYFTLATLAFQIVVFSILYNWETVTGGSYGISAIPGITVFGYEMSGTGDYAIVGGVVAMAIVTFFYFFQKTPFVRVLECIRDSEIGAISLGKNIAYYKFVCNSLASVFLAIAGSLFAAYSTYIDATLFTLNESILIVNMILIGGTGNIKGPILGALLYALLPELIRLIAIDSSKGASMQMIIYSLILILTVRFRPSGLFGKFKFE